MAHALSVATSGTDIVQGNGGDTFTENLLITVPVTIQSYGTGQATIAGGTGVAIQIMNAGNVTLNNLAISCSSSTYSGGSATILPIQHTTSGGTVYTGFTVTNCTITSGQQSLKITHSTADSGGLTGITIQGNTISGASLAGINIGASSVRGTNYNYSNILITQNVISNITASPNGNSSGNAIIMQECNTVAGPSIISFNTFHDLGALGGSQPDCGFAWQCEGCDGIIVEYNIAYNLFAPDGSGSHAGTAYDIDVQSSNCIVRYNYAYDCDGALLGVFSGYNNNKMYGNIGVNVARLSIGGIDMELGVNATPGGTCWIFNNTVIVCSSRPCVWASVASAMLGRVIANNALYAPIATSTVNVPSPLGNFVMDGNYHQSGAGAFQATFNGTNYTTFSAWKTATSLEASGVAAGNAYLVQPQPMPAALAGLTGYAPIAGSPLINAGANLQGAYGITPQPDALGNQWIQNTIGAVYPAAVPASYIAAVYQDDPICLFRLDEQSGPTFIDSAASTKIGTWTSATLGSTVLVPGDGATSIAFNGTASVGQTLALNALPAYSSFTAEAWIKLTSVATSDQTIVAAYHNGFNYNPFRFYANLTTLSAFFIGASSGTLSGSAPGFTLAINTLYHVAVTVTGTTLTFYVDGVAQTTTYASRQAVLPGVGILEVLIGNGNVPASQGVFGNESLVALYPSALSGARLLAHYNAGLAANYSLTGPPGGSIGTASATFEITPTAIVTDSGTISASGGTLSATTYSLVASKTPVPFTITPSGAGPITITVTSSNSLGVNGSPATYVATPSFTITGPASMIAGVASTLTVTPSGTTTDVATLNDGAMGGSFASTLTFTASNVAQTVSYTPSANTYGPLVISGTSTHFAAFTPLSTASYNVWPDPVYSKNATFSFLCNSVILGGNSKYVPALITNVSTSPTIKVNGSVVQIGIPEYVQAPFTNDEFQQNYQQYVQFLPECGGVAGINMVNPGTASYTNPTFTATTLNGCSGLVLANSGVGTTASGFLSYTFSGGSGFTTSFGAAVPAIPGQSPTLNAWVWVTVVAGSVVSVVPMTGSQMSSGVGYTGTTHTFTLAGGGGTGLSVTGTVGNYVIPPLITTPGTGATAPVVFTITDPGGSGVGATCVAQMTGPLSTDTITYSAPAGWISTQFGVTGGTVPPATNATVVNSLGALEPNGVYSTGFQGIPVMGAGGNLGFEQASYSFDSYFTPKNKFKAHLPAVMGFGTTDCALDATFYPQYWNTNGWINIAFYTNQGGTGTPQYTGQWAVEYDDDFYSSGSTKPMYVNMIGSTVAPVNGPHTTLPTTTCTVSGGAINALTITNGGSGLQSVLFTFSGGGGSNAAVVPVMTSGVLTGYNILNGGENYTSAPTVTVTPIAVSGMAVTILYNVTRAANNVGDTVSLSLGFVTPDGTQHAHNVWVFAPNNTIDRSKPLASDDNFVAYFTANGNGPGVLRYMDDTNGAANANMMMPTDLLPVSYSSWQIPYNVNQATTPGPPNSPTFTGVCTAGSPIITGIANTAALGGRQPDHRDRHAGWAWPESLRHRRVDRQSVPDPYQPQRAGERNQYALGQCDSVGLGDVHCRALLLHESSPNRNPLDTLGCRVFRRELGDQRHGRIRPLPDDDERAARRQR